MSVLLDRLDRISRGTPTAMGFGAVSRPDKVPSMAMIGLISDRGKPAEQASTLAKIGVDGVLVEGVEKKTALASLSKALDKVPWGLRLTGIDEEAAGRYREQGCDFLAFGAEGSTLSALEDEDAGYLLCIQSDWDERRLRAIEHLPVDGVVLALQSADPPLTIEHLIAIGSVRGEFSKYLLLEVPGLPTSGELEGLREIGVDGLVVDAALHSAEDLQGLRDRLMALPKRQRGTKKASAVLPSGAYGAQGTAPDDDDEDDW
jgi:hypothetical protein